MIQEKSFETTFNEWYKMFLEEEKKLTVEVTIAKKHKEEKISNARKEASDYLKKFEQEERETLAAEKAKISASQGKSTNQGKTDDLDKVFKKEIEEINASFKVNKARTIDFLIEKIFEVNLDLPDSIIKKSLVNKKK